jgi:hypothetical protein
MMTVMLTCYASCHIHFYLNLFGYATLRDYKSAYTECDLCVILVLYTLSLL